jgi:thioredoxin reductase (NADPH)
VPGDRQNLVKTSEGDLTTQVVIIASGSRFRKLGVPGEDDLTGKGVSYCATCDGPLFRGRPVAVVGGGNAAITEALQLSKFASRVSVIHRRNQLAAGKILIERAKASPNIEFIWDTVVAEVEGKVTVEQLRLKNTKNATISTLPISGVFVAVGLDPDTGYLQGILPLDKEGYVITNELMETGVPGILAAGDVRHNSIRQAITAAGDGATAAVSAERFLGRIGHY